jgi:hypothetical protein
MGITKKQNKKERGPTFFIVEGGELLLKFDMVPFLFGLLPCSSKTTLPR